MKKVIFSLLVLFTLASCSKDDSDFYVSQIITLEQQMQEVSYERDVLKAKLQQYETPAYLFRPDTAMTMSLTSIKNFIRFYPN